ncbi:MAG TPA: peroxiredoxin [Gammaproteobacteria bacterium]|jgi:peroxiredoxin Q/BCP|nr:peroxiredoxin [Gammaproteobacteria bacterium]
MKKLLLAGLASVAVALPVVAALQKGDTAPLFTAKASLAGKEFNYSLAEALKQGPVVVYFYPSAYTQGCNIQAHTFAENMDAFKAAKASVIGVSLDSIQRLNDFSADPAYCAGKLPVASDADGAIAKSYSVNVREGRAGMQDSRGVAIDHGFAERLTFVVKQDGKIAALIGEGNLPPDQNVQQALQAVKELGAL